MTEDREVLHSGETMNPKPCPWCHCTPIIEPVDAARDGGAWGLVRCTNAECPAQPCVRDGEAVADDRGSAAYRAAAVRRWNTWGENPPDAYDAINERRRT